MAPQDVITEVRQGVSPVCATCKHYWSGRERGLPRPQCTTVLPCGSPIAGDTFSQYKGPITDFEQFCFVCSREANFAVKVREEKRMIGICRDHVVLLSRIEASVGDKAHLIQLTSGNGRLPLLQLLPKPKPSLFAAIAASEQEFDDESRHVARKKGLLRDEDLD